ncbi:EutN/CcmL family microcompartment protein [Desulfosediminicola flagellatus]|uniref:EutN/CcmL family microcompartment protein n=1 Tax=Desulfosediminicola flagellatus TaxID=2569541 RepID=UPI0010ACD3C4|nr:EutN/CcmL family microcompartment protein [Desulfosediminicola flagellatus]
MIVAKVVGNIWATRKEESLQGMKLMIVQVIDPVTKEHRNSFVAVDQVGAGIGEMVIVSTGSSARLAKLGRHSPIDAIIVGIVDEMDVPGKKEMS